MGRGQLVEGHFFPYLLPLFYEMKSRLALKVVYSENIFHLGSNLPKDLWIVPRIKANFLRLSHLYL